MLHKMRASRYILAICIAIIGLVCIWINVEKWDRVVYDKNSNIKTIYNVWLLSCTEEKVKCLNEGKIMEYIILGKLPDDYTNTVADITVKGDVIIKLALKTSKIQGRVLGVSDGSIDIEKYGKIECTKDFKLYKSVDNNIIYEYGGIKYLDNNMNDIEYVVEGNKICAGIIRDDNKIAIKGNGKDKKIRVLLKNSSYNRIYHNEVKLTSNDRLQILYVDNAKEVVVPSVKITEYGQSKLKKKTYRYANVKPKESIRLTPKSKLFAHHNRVIIRNVDNREGILISSIKRSVKNLRYGGNIEIVKDNNRLVIINEVGLEKYLYSVVPSEMPERYNIEALKAQAICARTYAMSRIEHSGYKQYGAHVDDSISYQVYNNQEYGSKSRRAVDETKGKVIKDNDVLASIFYYSTSCGYSSKAKDVFGEKNIKYLISKKQTILDYKLEDMGNEKIFRKYILSTDGDCFEKKCEWFRWQTKVSVDKLSKSVNENLAFISKSKKNNNILEYDKSKKKYIVKKVNSVGKIRKIKVSKRKSGGVVTEIIIYGSSKRVCVKTQYLVRNVLGMNNLKIIRNDKSTSRSNKLLPSSYFVIDKKGDTFYIYGGGYGHGVGMSQCGANELAKQGKNYLDIIQFYFPNTKVVDY